MTDRKENSAVICFSRGSGGMEIDAANLTRQINQHLGACLLLVRSDTWLHNFAIQHSIPHRAIAFKRSLSISAAFAIRRIWDEKIIVNIIFFGSSEIPTIYLSLTRNIKSFIVRHGTTKSSSKKDIVHKITWSRVTSHWCISKHIENNVKKIFPIGSASTFVNYISITDKLDRIPLAAELKTNTDTLRLVHVGRLVEGKGQRDAVITTKLLRDMGVPASLTLIGEGEDKTHIEEMVIDLNIGDHITILGYKDEPYVNFSEFHAFLFPSHGEGLGNSFIEALSSGMHCFCYKNTVFPELHDIGLEFAMTKNNDTNALANSIKTLWRNKSGIMVSNRDLCKSVFSISNEMLILGIHLK